MSIPQSVAQVLREHVALEIEGIDRMCLNAYVPQLQREGGVASFFRFHRGYPFASSALMDPISKAFVAEMEDFAEREGVPVVRFRKGERKDDLRRLRWHGLIERIPHSHRYELTTLGLRVALFFSRTYARLLRPFLSEIAPNAPPGHSPIRAAFERLQTLIDQACQEAQLVTV